MENLKNSDLKLSIEWEGKSTSIQVLIRPGCREFLRRMTRLFEVVIFTASVSNYADPLMKELDGQGYGFYKLYREHCTYRQNSYLKDLSRMGRELKDLIIVDNLPHSYRLQPENGIPISSWYDDQSDTELDTLASLLERLASVEDVRPYIQKIVRNEKVCLPTANSIFNA